MMLRDWLVCVSETGAARFRDSALPRLLACLSVCTVNRSVFYASEGAVMSGRPWICQPRLSHLRGASAVAGNQMISRRATQQWGADLVKCSTSVGFPCARRVRDRSDQTLTWFPIYIIHPRPFPVADVLKLSYLWACAIPLVFYLSSVCVAFTRAEACGAIHPQKKNWFGRVQNLLPQHHHSMLLPSIFAPLCWLTPDWSDPCRCCRVLPASMSVNPVPCVAVKAVWHTVAGKNVFRRLS